jgi:hypothetical protein
MKKFIFAVSLYLFGLVGYSQSITLPPSGDNQKCSLTQWVGLVSVNITYNSPDVTGPNGEDRKGKIWGGVVPYGLADNNFGTAKKMPWRAGANENTTITFSHDVKVEGSAIPSGTYSLHMIPSPDKWVIIFSRDAGAWGSYFYDERNDALRVEVTPVKGAYTEWLTYDFIDKKPSHTIAALRWENLVVPFKIEADVIDIYLAKIREELKSAPGFEWKNWVAAINFCVTRRINLQEALLWANYAIEAPFVGERNFETLTAKANVLILLNRNSEADLIIGEALNNPSASMVKIHNYGRQLLAAGQTRNAMDVFEINSEKYPDDRFTTMVGLARGYEALGKKKQAAKHYRIAAENAPDGQIEYYQNLANNLQ